MAESIVSFAVERIGDLLIDEAKFLLKVPDEVEDLQKNLAEMLCLLKDADTRQQEDHVVRNWVSEIRDLAYDAEDVIEDYILKVTSMKSNSFRNTFSNYLNPRKCVDIHMVGSKIERINSRIPDLTRKMLEYGIRCTAPSNTIKRLAMKRKEYSHTEEDYVGMEDHVDEIVRELTDESKQHRVVSLWGMGGLGKTSLARKMYMDKRVRDHYEYFAWTCVSQDYQVEKILREILRTLDPQKGEAATEVELKQSLYKILQEKRCLVILDDIWTNDVWDCLKAALPIKKSLSKILITTRNKEIARYMDPHSFSCNLRCMTEDESWELLKGRAFSDTHDLTIDQGMEDVGRRIIKQCGYLPLAIIVIGGVLAYKTTMEEWELVLQNIELHLQKGNNEVLELSYIDLPYHLKPCFLYLGNIPEDSWISIRSLVRMWIAEGFVTNHESRTGVSILDVSESYVNELVDRGMVQAKAKKVGKRVGYIRLHDLMRDLSIRKSTEENFSVSTKIMDGGSSHVGLSTFQNFKIRRLAMFMKLDPLARDQEELKRMPQLRSLIWVVNNALSEWEDLFPVDQVSKKFKYLRVLDLVAFSSQNVIISESIGDLIHLRHFRMVAFRMKKLPSAIGNLELLETFDIKECRVSNSASIPNVLWKMKRLREICLPICSISNNAKKLRLDCLENLEIFENFSFRMCEVNDLQKFTRLRKLTFHCNEEKDCWEGFGIFSLLEKIKFKKLQLVSFKFGIELWGVSFPEDKLRELALYTGSCRLCLSGTIRQVLPVFFPPMLRKLNLHHSKLEEDPMPILEKLPNLETLGLLPASFNGKKLVCSGGGFPKLTSLTLSKLVHLEEMKFVEGTMPCLLDLWINICHRLKMIPEGLDFISSHGKLNFTYTKENDMYALENFQMVKEERGWVYHIGELNLRLY